MRRRRNWRSASTRGWSGRRPIQTGICCAGLPSTWPNGWRPRRARGEHFRIFISGAAFKRVNRKIRQLLIGPKRMLPMKGIVVPVAVHELYDSFVDPSSRLNPDFLETFFEGRQAGDRVEQFRHVDSQLLSTRRRRAELCEVDRRRAWTCAATCSTFSRTMEWRSTIWPRGLIERDQLAAAIPLLTDLTHCWPTYTDGWLELARVAKKTGNLVLGPAMRAAGPPVRGGRRGRRTSGSRRTGGRTDSHVDVAVMSPLCGFSAKFWLTSVQKLLLG